MGKRLTQIATRTGDDGTTGLGNNTRVSKNSLRPHAMGDVDELNSHIGLLLCEDLPADVRELLIDIQHQLFNLGGEISIPGFELLKDDALAQLDAALAEARQAGKPVLLDWYADWGISCKVIERQVLTDPTVQARLPAYRLLRFDITESNPAQRGLLDRYNLFGPPAILFFAPGGDEWSDLRVIGEIDAAGLAERLRRAAARQ